MVISIDDLICRIEVYPSTQEEVYYDEGPSQQFFVRLGNGTRSLSMSDANKYIQDHWK